MPEVSIIIPCYNQAWSIDETLGSVLNQTFKDWECIVVNDGSPDDIDTIVRNWLKKDVRFKYITQENRGLSEARNAGIRDSEGKYIIALDADDKISSDYIEKLYEEFLKNKSLKVAYANGRKFGDVNEPLDLPVFSLSGLSKKNMIYCSAMFKREDWERVGGYDPEMKYGLEDWEFWIAILKDGGMVTRLDFVGFYYRIKENSMLTNLSKSKRDEMLRYLSIKHADFFVNQKGSFFELENEKYLVKNRILNKLKSKKVILNLFFKIFFGFYILKNWRIK